MRVLLQGFDEFSFTIVFVFSCRWLINYLTEEQKKALSIVLQGNPTIEYADYDWRID